MEEHFTKERFPSNDPIRHPEANTALVLGIIAIPLCLGPLGLAVAAFGIIAGTRAIRGFQREPGKYTRESYTRGLTGLICSMIAISLFVLLSFFYVTWRLF